MSTAPPRTSRTLLTMVALLYVAEGLPAGIFHNLVDVWLIKDRGVDIATIGLVGLLGLPWSLKLLWSPLVDRTGTAAEWITASLLVVGLVTALLPWMTSGTEIWVLLGCLTMASATADVAIDGYTTTVVPKELHGRVNGWRVAAYRGAMLVSGGGAVALAGWLDWRLIFAIVGVATLGLAVWTIRLPPIPKPDIQNSEWWSELWEWLSRPGSLALFCFVLLFKMGDAAMAPMIKPFWLKPIIEGGAGFSEVELGLVSISLGAGLTVVGALMGGEIATRWGLFKSLWALGALQAISNLAYMGAAMMPTRTWVYGASMVESFCSGLGVAAFLAFLMRICEARQAATRFAILTSISMITGKIAGAPSGYFVQTWGYAAYFGFTFLLALPAFALLPAIRKRVAITES